MQSEDDKKDKKQKLEEPVVPYQKETRIFHSYLEQEEYELKKMASFSPEEILMQMRKLINIAYGMHGFDPEKLPKKHTIKIVKRG